MPVELVPTVMGRKGMALQVLRSLYYERRYGLGARVCFSTGGVWQQLRGGGCR